MGTTLYHSTSKESKKFISEYDQYSNPEEAGKEDERKLQKALIIKTKITWDFKIYKPLEVTY